jgi:tetratricopeptide (TPR) repeat protein
MVRIWLVLVSILAISHAAWAQKHKKADPEQEKRDAEARDHYEKGLKHYNLGEFDPAVEEFKKAYELSDAPGLLFNIAQVYRAKEDYKQALYFYRTYLRLQPDAPNRADVEARVADLERLVAEKQKLQDAPPKETIPPENKEPLAPTPQMQTPPPQRRDTGEPGSGKTFELAGLITAGVGVALLGTGIVFGLSASSASDDLTKASQMGTPWSPALQQKYDDGQSAQTKATLFTILGGAAIVGGGVLYYLGWNKNNSSVALAPLPGGTAMVVTCRF